MVRTLSQIDPGVLALGVVILFAWTVVLQVAWIVWWVRLRRLFRGASGRDLEAVITGHANELEGLRRRERETREVIARIREHLERALCNVHVIRFNPFGAGGAEQSFSIALLDSTGSGVVISCLQSGDGGSRVYGKPVERRTSPHRLSPEEERAITEAMKGH